MAFIFVSHSLAQGSHFIVTNANLQGASKSDASKRDPDSSKLQRLHDRGRQLLPQGDLVANSKVVPVVDMFFSRIPVLLQFHVVLE